MILHDGEILYEGSPQIVAPVYERFSYRINRFDHVHSKSTEDGSETVSIPESAPPGDVIRRAVRSVERTGVAPDVVHQVAQVWNNDEPIIVGPCLSDVGLELLYWRPFVAWIYSRFGTPVSYTHLTLPTKA